MGATTPCTKLEQLMTERFDTMLNSMDPLLLQGYKQFLHEVIIQGISRNNLPLDTLSRCLFNLNRDHRPHC